MPLPSIRRENKLKTTKNNLEEASMRLSKFVSVLVFFFSAQALAHQAVPEYFYQPDVDQKAVEAGVSYADTSADNSNEKITPRLSASFGILEGLALRLGTSYTLEDGSNGFNDFNLDVLGWTALGSAKLHYGVEGSVTPSKSGSQRFSPVHKFNPYIGVSMGEELHYGFKFLYRSIRTAGDVLGNFDYSASLFGEKHFGEKTLAGASLAYDQTSGSKEDYASLGLYARMQMGESWFLTPSLKYAYALDDAFDDAYGVELAARFLF